MAVAESSDLVEEAARHPIASRTRQLTQSAEARLRQALRLYALSQNAQECAEKLSYLDKVLVRPQVNASYK